MTTPGNQDTEQQDQTEVKLTEKLLRLDDLLQQQDALEADIKRLSTQLTGVHESNRLLRNEIEEDCTYLYSRGEVVRFVLPRARVVEITMANNEAEEEFSLDIFETKGTIG